MAERSCKYANRFYNAHFRARELKRFSLEYKGKKVDIYIHLCM